MLIPLGTDRPQRRLPLMTATIVAANFAVFAVTFGVGRTEPEMAEGLVTRLAVGGPAGLGAWWTLVTSCFVHADALHLVGNVLVLWIFGQSVEDRLGRWWYLLFYLAGGVAAGLAHVATDDAPAIGASGAVAAVTGAFLILFPRTMVRCFVFFGVIGVFGLPAWMFIAAAVAKDFLLTSLAMQGNVATVAHLGGYAFGAGMAMALLASKVLAREEYDLYSALRQAKRRSDFRAAVEKGSRPARGAAGKLAAGEADRLAGMRAEVSLALAREDMAGAVGAYKALVGAFPAGEAATVLGRRQQLELANGLFRTGEHGLAAGAYDGFAAVYPEDGETPRVRVLLALVCARYLKDSARARRALAGAREGRLDAEQRALAEELWAELTPEGTPGRG